MQINRTIVRMIDISSSIVVNVARPSSDSLGNDFFRNTPQEIERFAFQNAVLVLDLIRMSSHTMVRNVNVHFCRLASRRWCDVDRQLAMDPFLYEGEFLLTCDFKLGAS